MQMTTQEHKMLKLFTKRPYSFDEFKSKYLTTESKEEIFLSLTDREFIDFDKKTDMISISTPGKIAYRRFIGEKRDSFREWFNRSFFLGTLSGIVIGVASTLLAQYLLNLHSLMP